MRAYAAWERMALLAVALVSALFVRFAVGKLTTPASTPQDFRYGDVRWAAAAEPPSESDAEPTTVARLVFVGDIMQHGIQADDDFASSYAAVSPWLQSADLAVGNLEFPVDPLRSVARRIDSVQFNGSLRHLDALAAAGFDLLSTANNHCFDQDWDGLRRTQEELVRRKVRPIGNLEGELQEEPVVWDLTGLKVGFFAYSFRANTYSDSHGKPRYRDRNWPLHELNFMEWRGEYRAEGLAKLQRHAAVARERGVEVLVALVHWGREWSFVPDDHQRRAAGDFEDAGFQLVVGSHGHVLNPVESRERALIAYSLGNFCSAFSAGEARVGGLLCVDIARRVGGAPSLRFRGVLPLVVEGPRRRLAWVRPDLPEHESYQQLAERVLGAGCVFQKNFPDPRHSR